MCKALARSIASSSIKFFIDFCVFEPSSLLRNCLSDNALTGNESSQSLLSNFIEEKQWRKIRECRVVDIFVSMSLETQHPFQCSLKVGRETRSEILSLILLLSYEDLFIPSV